MAISTAPFALKNLGLDAEPLRQAVASLVPNQGGLVQTGDFSVTQTTTPSLAVSVGVGRVWMPGNNISNLASQTYSTQGQYFALNDAPVTVSLTTADATNPRIDLIYVGTVDTQYGGASNVVKIDKIIGTPAASPVAPTLPAGSNAIALATVTVAANATSILNANITNVATSYKTMRAEFVRISQTDNPSGSLWGPGAVFNYLDANNSKNYSSWVAAGPNDAIRVTQEGSYLVDWKIVNAQGTSFTVWHTISTDGSGFTQVNNTSLGRSTSYSVPAQDPYFASANFYVPPGGMDVYFKFSCGTANANMHHRIRVTKVN